MGVGGWERWAPHCPEPKVPLLVMGIKQSRGNERAAGQGQRVGRPAAGTVEREKLED